MPVTQTQKQGQLLYKVKEPKKYNVIMHNDDYTTMDFVVMVLINIFHKSEDDANTIMMKIHMEGNAIVGTYTKDIAESKKKKTVDLARENSYPLALTVEEV